MNPYLLTSIEFGPVVVQRLVRQIPRTDWDRRTSPERFTVREQVAHLADWEPYWLERFQLGLREPGGRITVYDEGQLAIDHDYASRDPFKEATRFIEGRKPVAALLRSLTPAQFAIQIDHPERGVLTLEDMANMLLGHDLYHIEHLSEYAAGK